jgi:BASS family bile acid:Na+ symporter
MQNLAWRVKLVASILRGPGKTLNVLGLSCRRTGSSFLHEMIGGYRRSALMNAQTLILFTLKASVALSVFAIGLESRPKEAAYLLSRPAQLARSLVAMDVIMPLIAIAIVVAFDLSSAIEIALVALAVSPVPPLLPKKQIKAHGEPSYAIGLSVAAAVVAVVFIPVAAEFLGRYFHTSAHMEPWPIARLVLATIFVPLIAGMLVNKFAAPISWRIAKPLARAGVALLIVSILPILYTAWPAIVALVDNVAIVAIAAFVLLGLAVGHILGGPDPHHRTVLALATAVRHPGIALAIGTTNFPELKTIQPAILLYALLGAILTIPYVIWRKRAC